MLPTEPTGESSPRRHRILDAAEELFAERGFHRTSFMDIARRSGTGRGTIPWHFKNKHVLAMAVVQRAAERVWPAGQFRSAPSLTELFSGTTRLLNDGSSALVLTMLVEALNDWENSQEHHREVLRRGRESF
ncbi:helix-turn-helix domain-containing protein, partial [Lentzea sp.]|uniref:TetR/AcrR family transcriptional regulator n=1 Tax=Lentzea sp. TaxID=56099 RepID=UPI002ED64AAC